MVKTNKDNSYSITHCIERYKERYNKDMSLDDYNKLNNLVIKWLQIPNNNIQIISKDKIIKNNYSYILETKFNEEIIYFVFETERNCITTFLPVKSVNSKINKKLKK